MDTPEHLVEAGERNAEMEIEAGVARIRAANRVIGDDDCIDCGDPIPLDRRMALPSAARCIECQQLHERKYRD